jgi:hypothetical protein
MGVDAILWMRPTIGGVRMLGILMQVAGNVKYAPVPGKSEDEAFTVETEHGLIVAFRGPLPHYLSKNKGTQRYWALMSRASPEMTDILKQVGRREGGLLQPRDNESSYELL